MTTRLFLKLSLVVAVSSVNAQPENSTTPSPSARQLYIIEFDQQGAVHYQGNVPGLERTAGILRSRTRNAGANPQIQSYLSHIENRQLSKQAELESAIGRALEVKYRYRVTHSGIAAELSANEAEVIRTQPGVERVYEDVIHELVTDAGPAWIGAESIWDGTATGDAPPNQGEGVIIGVLDTGVNSDHPSFSDTPEDGYIFTNPFGDGVFVGDCGGAVTCNNKLIGAWNFAGDGPEDNNGHGSHTASTAGGNALAGPFIDTPSGNVFDAPSIAGVAPHANIIAYDVCTAGCSSAAILGAVDQAILDGVDVINFSISGGTLPWVDNDRRFLDAVAAGVTVVAAAGNTSAADPDPIGDVNHRAPWVLAVANQSHDRVNSNNVSIVGGPTNVMDLYGLLGVVDNFSGDLTADITYAGDVDAGNFEGCTAWPGGNEFTGNIALISRGSCSFEDKINFAAAAGAVGVIIFNNASIIPIVMGGIESTTIPSLMVGQVDGEAMRDHVQMNPGSMATMSGTAVRALITAAGSILNGSSLRGPNNFDVTKPDIAAPGTNIFAAVHNNAGAAPQLGFLSGTSMASPHTAGAAALIKSIHPDWTPSQIYSALMMTARQGFDESGNPANPDLEGSGTVDLTKAAEAGLTMDETFNDYLDANPATGGDPSTLNLPSMRSIDCDGNCTWQRYVCNTLDDPATWSATVDAPAGTSLTVDVTAVPPFSPPPPAGSFSVLGGDFLTFDGFGDSAGPRSSCQLLEIEMTINDNQLVIDGNLLFGSITLSEDGAQAPDAIMTVTVLPTGTD